jgi:hypothetical protein
MENPGKHFLLIYPNPVTDIIHIEINQLKHEFGSELIITDVLGQVKVCQSMQTENENISVTNLSPGTYFIKFFDKKMQLFGKFIKQ